LTDGLVFELILVLHFEGQTKGGLFLCLHSLEASFLLFLECTHSLFLPLDL